MATVMCDTSAFVAHEVAIYAPQRNRGESMIHKHERLGNPRLRQRRRAGAKKHKEMS